jgi:hypothetical protein
VSKSGIQTEFGERNAAFIDARKWARKGSREQMQQCIEAMNAIQAVTKREREAIEKCLPERRHPAPRK